MSLRNACLTLFLALWCTAGMALPFAPSFSFAQAQDTNLLWSADYDAYGKAQTRTTADAGTAITNNLRYPGQYWDAESGLHYNDRRYYDPDTGRYASSDPLGFEGGINLYTYAAAAPGRYVDPTGEIIPCLVANYARCMLTCGIQGVAMQAIGNALSGCGDIDLLEIAKDCAVDCLWSMLPIPDPCGKFGKLLSVVAGGMGGSSGPNSFTGETVVHIRDANGKPALKPIAQIQIGDEVLAWDEAAVIDGQLSQASPLGQAVQAKTGSSARPASASRYEKVSGVITSEVQQKLVHVTLEDGKTITATQGHPFRTDEGWRDAILLKRGGKLLLKGSGDEEADSQESGIRTATIADVQVETKVVRVFNLEVENLHTFFVGDEGYVVHNGRGATGKAREKIWTACGGKCSYCGCTLQRGAGAANSFECDHYYPVAGGGDPGPGNQVGSCRSCNRKWGKNWPGGGGKPTLPGR